MSEFLASLPLQGWLALLGLIGAAVWKPAELAAKWLRASGAYTAANASKAAELDSERDGRLIQQLLDRMHELEQMMEVHRKALDKSLVRENGVLTAAEILIGIVELIPEPTEPMKLMRLRAIEILELAKRLNGSRGGPA